MLGAGEILPPLTATSYEDQTFDLGSPGVRTVLWFSPKGGIVDELGDKLLPSHSP